MTFTTRGSPRCFAIGVVDDRDAIHQQRQTLLLTAGPGRRTHE
jgi:hypothetical protein